MSRLRLLGLLVSCVTPLGAQERPVPYPVTAPETFHRAVASGTRTTTGAPGSRYWQQWTRYALRTRLDVASRRLDGEGRITYHNHSPDTLRVLFLHLVQNVHAQGAARNEAMEVTGGATLTRVVVNGQSARSGGDRAPRYDVSGTVLGVRLARPVSPGDTAVLDVSWRFTIPQQGAGARMGWSRDNLFHLAYWYPQMAVYDDVGGWQTEPFLGNAEFYAGFGTYDVTIDVPEGWVVVGTGRLTNDGEVLPDVVRERLRRAERSDSVVHVLTASDLASGGATRRAPGGRLAWQFRADSVRDVAYSITRESRWDAGRTPVGDRDGDGRTDYARVDALYRATAPRWARTWRYAQHAIDFLSRFTGFAYPWPHMTAVEGGGIITGGMEFPMITLIGDYNDRGDSALYYVTAHELSHMWLPMIVASDERRRSWLDEGTTTFNENQSRREFFPGPDHDADDRDDYLALARAHGEGEMMRWSDHHYSAGAYTVASYRKPATLLVALRGLLGEEVFRRGYHGYVRAWAYKHPTPWDFFNAFNSAAGADLGWFWRTWYYETWVLDHAVGEVRSGAEGTTIVVEDRGLAPMPARLAITRATGEVLRREVPVETWLSGATRAEVRVPPGEAVVRVEIDAEGVFPDIDRRNNRWTR